MKDVSKNEICKEGEHYCGEKCVCIKCGEEVHHFINDRCVRCNAVKRFETYQVREEVPCFSCTGRGGDYDRASNSYHSFCPDCGGTGVRAKMVTKQRSYIVHIENQ
ncbi:MAG: hypothetical protein LBI36_02460 [Oscillospiraceae bacterium]|jgi:hypothetical protein|nr:hypothetical protein [Oscillospiraceae bacterium]